MGVFDLVDRVRHEGEPHVLQVLRILAGNSKETDKSRTQHHAVSCPLAILVCAMTVKNALMRRVQLLLGKLSVWVGCVDVHSVRTTVSAALCQLFIYLPLLLVTVTLGSICNTNTSLVAVCKKGLRGTRGLPADAATSSELAQHYSE